MHRPQDIEKVLKRTPIEDVWGIGRRYSKRLHEMGIHTAYEFTQCNADWVRSLMGIGGERTWRELRGEACIEFEDGVQHKQSICTSRSFSSEIYDLKELQRQVAKFTSMTAEKLRKQQSVCGELLIFAWTNRFKDDNGYKGNSIVIPFQRATDSTIEMLKAANEALRKIYVTGCGYKKAGVIAYEISPRNQIQAQLFDNMESRNRHNKVMQAIDSINHAMGHNSIIIALASAIFVSYINV
jgi:DNA polymerase V